MRPLKCGEAEEFIIRDFDEGLDVKDKDRLEKHIQLCPDCADTREEFRLIFSTASSDVPQVPDEDYWIQYNNSLKAKLLEKESAGKPHWYRKAAFPALATAAAIMISIFGFRIDYNPSVQRTVSSSDVVIDDLEQVFGPSRSELVPSYDNSTITVVNGLSDEGVVRWFEIEDEPSHMFL
jgi:hypothetical protein